LVVIIGLGWFLTNNKQETSVTPAVSPSEFADTATKIIAFGDSLTAGFGLSLSDAYPAQLERALKDLEYDVSVVNSGVSGETTRGNLERANFIKSQIPDIVILGIGGNDALRSLPLDQTRENILATIDILKEVSNPPQIILLQMQAPINSGQTYKQGFDSIYKEIEATKKVVLVPFLTEEIFFDPANKLPDGIHYNAIGYQKVIDQHLLSAIVTLLNASQ